MSGLLFPFLPGDGVAAIHVTGDPAISSWFVNDGIASVTETTGAGLTWGTPARIHWEPIEVQYVTGEPAVWCWHINNARVTLGDPLNDYADDLALLMAMA